MADTIPAESPKKDKQDWAELSDEDENLSQRSGDEGQEDEGQEDRKEETKEGTSNTQQQHHQQYRPRNNGQRPKRPTNQPQSQPKEEMINLIKKSNEPIIIALFNVNFNADENTIRDLYQSIKIDQIDNPKQGLFLVEFNKKDEAMKFVEDGPKFINKRPFFMKIGYSNKLQKDDNWHHVNREDNRYTGKREDKPRRYNPNYNRKEQGDYIPGNYLQQERNYEKPYQKKRDPNREYNKDYNKDQNKDYKKNRPYRDERPEGERRPQQETPQIDPDDKYFKKVPQEGDSKIPKFTRSEVNPEKKENPDKDKPESSQPIPKPVKINPFGEAKPRDEKEYLKKKEEEIPPKEKQEEKPEEPSKDQQITESKPEKKQSDDEDHTPEQEETKDNNNTNNNEEDLINQPPPGMTTSPSKRYRNSPNRRVGGGGGASRYNNQSRGGGSGSGVGNDQRNKKWGSQGNQGGYRRGGEQGQGNTRDGYQVVYREKNNEDNAPKEEEEKPKYQPKAQPVQQQQQQTKVKKESARSNLFDALNNA